MQQAHNDEDIIAFSKVKIKDIIAAALVSSKAQKMAFNYQRSLGVHPRQLKNAQAEVSRKAAQDEEVISGILKKFTLDKFLEYYEAKSCEIDVISEIVKKYRLKETVLNEGQRKRIWKVLTRADKRAKVYYKMYSGLTKSLTDSTKDFAQIIDLDVKRTKVAIEDPAIYKKLTNVLLSYAK